MLNFCNLRLFYGVVVLDASYSIPLRDKCCLFKLGDPCVGFLTGRGLVWGWCLVGWSFLSAWNYCQAVVGLGSACVCRMSCHVLFCSWASWNTVLFPSNWSHYVSFFSPQISILVHHKKLLSNLLFCIDQIIFSVLWAFAEIHMMFCTWLTLDFSWMICFHFKQFLPRSTILKCLWKAAHISHATLVFLLQAVDEYGVRNCVLQHCHPCHQMSFQYNWVHL